MKTRVNFVLVLATIFSLMFGVYGFFLRPEMVKPQRQSDVLSEPSETGNVRQQNVPEQGAAKSPAEEELKAGQAPELPEPDAEPTLAPERDANQTGRITGLVLDRAYQPVAGARITAIDTGMLDVVQSAWTKPQTDEDVDQSIQELRRALVNGRGIAYTDKYGRFEVTGLDAASYFNLEGFSRMHGTVERLGVRCGNDLTLRFEAAGVLVVRLQDENGAPVTRSIAFAQYDGWASSLQKSSSDGVYFVEFEASENGNGTRSVTFKSKGYLPSRQFTLEDVGKPDLVAVLRKGARVHGAVTDQSGEPIRGATVTIKSATLDSGEKLDTTALLDEDNETNTDGCFEFSSLYPGRYEFAAWLSEDAVIDGETRTVQVSEDHEINFTLDTGAHAIVVVAGENSENVPRFGVNFWRDSSDMPVSALQIPGQGSNRKKFIGLPRSTVQFSVHADGFCTYYSNVDLSSGEGAVHVTLSRGAMVKGRVVGNGGTLVRGVRTRWTPTAPGAVINRWGEAPEGTFSLGPLEPGTWAVDVYSDVHSTEKIFTQTIQLAAGEAPVEIVLDPAHLISVKLEFASGLGAWANIHLTPEGEEAWESVRYDDESKSKTRLIAVPPGTYDLYASTDRLYSPVVKAKPGGAVTLALKDPDCVRITHVAEGSNAGRAGIQTGDLVIEYDLQPVGSVADLVRLTKQTEGRAGVQVIVVRNGETRELTVKGGMLGVGVAWAAR